MRHRCGFRCQAQSCGSLPGMPRVLGGMSGKIQLDHRGTENWRTLPGFLAFEYGDKFNLECGIRAIRRMTAPAVAVPHQCRSCMRRCLMYPNVQTLHMSGAQGQQCHVFAGALRAVSQNWEMNGYCRSLDGLQPLNAVLLMLGLRHRGFLL